EQRHVGANRAEQLQRLDAVARFARDLDIGVELQHPAQALADQRLVFHHADADHGRPRTGNSARSEKPLPAAVSTKSVPPALSTRSRMPRSPFPARNSQTPRPPSRALSDS